MTPGRSVATDSKLFPHGALAFISTARPIPGADGKPEPQKLGRFVLNQDTGFRRETTSNSAGEFEMPMPARLTIAQVMQVHAEGYHVWTGLPTTGDELRVALEKKDSVPE